MVGRDDLVIDRTSHNALDLVGQLADVAFPIANHQQVDRLRCERNVSLAETFAVMIDVVIHDRWYLAAAFAKRRHAKANYVEAVI